MTDVKPFDVERAKAGDPVMLRNGRKMEFIGVRKQHINGYCVVAAVPGENTIFLHTIDGRYTEGKDGDRDLVMAPIKRKYYFYSWPIVIHEIEIEE